MVYIPPPEFRIPRHTSSLGALIAESIGQGLSDVFAAKDSEKKRKILEEKQRKAEERQTVSDQMEAEDRLLKLAPILSEFEAAPPTPMDNTGVDEFGLSTAVGGVPEGGIQLGEQRQAAPLLSELTMPTGKKIKIAPIRGGKERAEAAAKAEAEKGTEVLSPEVHAELPAFYKARWKPGQRVSTANLGTVGMEIFKSAEDRATKAAESKAKTEAELASEARTETRAIEREGRAETRTIAAEGRTAARAEAKAAGEKSWVTDKSGGRVMVTQKQLNEAAPGAYSDVRPAVQKAPLSSGQMKESREGALRVLGGPKDTDPDSVWNLAAKLTVPGPAGITGVPAKIAGMAGSITKFTGLPGSADIELYQSQIEGFAPMFARSVGHTGVLTEKDVKRTERLFPVITGPKADSRAVAIRKLNRLKDIMSGKEGLPEGTFEPQEGHWPPSPAAAPAASSFKPGSKIGRFTVVSVE